LRAGACSRKETVVPEPRQVRRLISPSILFITLIALSASVVAGRSDSLLHPSRATPGPQASQASPPLFVDAVVVDRKGNIVDDMKAADFQVTLDGRPRRVVSISRFYRGPGAGELAAMQPAAGTGELRPRVQPNRTLVLVVDQGSFLPGDERRARLIAENCLGLFGLNDQLGLITLPNLGGGLPISREEIRSALGGLKGLRLSDDSATGAADDAQKDVAASGAGATGAADAGRADVTGSSLALPEKLEDLLSADRMRNEEALSTEATRKQAVTTLGGLKSVLDALGRGVSGSKTVLLLSAGIVNVDVSGQIEQVVAASAAAETRIYVLQVPTPAAKFSAAGRGGLLEIAQRSGGTLVTLAGNAGESLQRMSSELSSSYLLMLDAQPGDDAPSHTLSVASRRRDVTIRAGDRLVPGIALPPEVPLEMQQVPSPVLDTSGSKADRDNRPARRDPELDIVVARAIEYVRNYSREVSAVVAEEVYEQKAFTQPGSLTGIGSAQSTAARLARPQSRKLVSDFLLVKVPGAEGWLPFRDVFEVDGKSVRERDGRLQKLFLEAPADKAIENANAILEESARYNIGPIYRNVNVPTLALMFLYSDIATHFRFNKRGEEDVAGMRTWVVEYTEQATPTIIKTRDGTDLPASGRFWIEPTSGRIVRTTLQAGGASITVRYAPSDQTPGVWLPVSMDEAYGLTTTAKATYSKVRRFQVFTDEKIK
jgi:hypothetical protein